MYSYHHEVCSNKGAFSSTAEIQLSVFDSVKRGFIKFCQNAMEMNYDQIITVASIGNALHFKRLINSKTNANESVLEAREAY